MDAGKYYALLRFEEAALALRAAMQLEIVEKIGKREVDLDELREMFGFTHQGARTYAMLLEVMEVLQRNGRAFSVTDRAAETLASDLATSRKPYLSMGTGDDVARLIAQLRGDFAETLPLYSGDDSVETVMDLPDVAREVAYGLASRARNFAEPLAAAIRPHVGKAKILADIGAGSPYVATACLQLMPQLNKAILVDRVNGMQFAREMAKDLDDAGGVEKLEFCEQDFFQSVPAADVYCVSNTAHDWLAEEYVTIMTNVRDSLAPGGLVCVHEPLLLPNWNSADQWVSALWMACYAVSLFRLTQGKGTCYSREEHNEIMSHCGFVPVGEPTATQDGCTALIYKLQADVEREAAEAPQMKSAAARGR